MRLMHSITSDWPEQGVSPSEEASALAEPCTWSAPSLVMHERTRIEMRRTVNLGLLTAER